MTQHLVTRADLLMFVVLLTILALVGGVTWEQLGASRDARVWSQHSFNVLGTLKDLSIALRDVETGQRGYLLTGKDEYLAPYDAARDRINLLQGELLKVTVDNAAQQQRLRDLSPVIQRKLEELAQTIQIRRDVDLDAALRIVNSDAGFGFMKRAEDLMGAMLAEEQTLLAAGLAENDTRAAWVRPGGLGGVGLAVLILLVAARLLNQAWSRSYKVEAEQRTLALRSRSSLESLSQGVAVFGADRRMTNWNHCFQVLLDVPKAMLRPGTPYAAFVEHTAGDGRPALETEHQIRHGHNA